ncbi:MBL fold metallo-hydrolase [Paeniglutamicibacter sp. Y32M11]|uniref:MBL fold metallo-hydrolase n=1 Tax=Paeniglutamicibacter sp. Y32M11 TaxID=2853258 RepID=UPI001C530599|nr:MBL fold metallo-hydrolase [Paeniglutamicibacter sp. Y32M11]QXQ10177.1 MBL fold metallo-hydrolase [Paeniglutamicibacter sp. Y32M11]
MVTEQLETGTGSGRRTFLAGSIGALGALTLAGCVPAAGIEASAGPATVTRADSAEPSGTPLAAESAAVTTRTRVVLLGTAGGPAIVENSRCGISTAVLYGDRVYLVDLGHASHNRMIDAGLASETPGAGSFARVRGIFFTHLHSDHTVEWPAVYATGAQNVVGRTWEDPIRVFGPGDRGTLPRLNPPGRKAPEVFGPESPTPGIVGTTALLRQAFAADFNDRMRDSNFGNPDATFEIQDIDLDGVWDIDPDGVPPRLDKPLEIWQDGDVKITATLVDHHPTAPAFAYRFDTPDGSVVVSGDTNVSANLIDLARGCDVLVHEVIDPAYVDRVAANLPEEAREPLKKHLLESHTTIEQVGRDVAEKAGAKTLVLSHLVPGNNPVESWQRAQEGYSGKLIVGTDLRQVPVG